MTFTITREDYETAMANQTSPSDICHCIVAECLNRSLDGKVYEIGYSSAKMLKPSERLMIRWKYESLYRIIWSYDERKLNLNLLPFEFEGEVIKQ